MSNPYRCPECGATDKIDIKVLTWARLDQSDSDNFETDTFAAQHHDHEWDDDSVARCAACGFVGTTMNFDPDDGEDADERPGRDEPHGPQCARRGHPTAECTCGKADRESEEEPCARCGGPRSTAGRCADATCPFSDHQQTCVRGWLGHHSHPEVDEKTPCTCDKDVVTRLTALAESKHMTAATLAAAAGVQPDRLNNGGVREVIQVLLDEGDDADWVRDLILDYESPPARQSKREQGGQAASGPGAPGFDVWGSAPDYPREDWQNQVASGDTNQGYWEWVAHEREVQAENVAGDGSHVPAELAEFCDECGEAYPDDADSLIGPWHKPSCSLHPKNQV